MSVVHIFLRCAEERYQTQCGRSVPMNAEIEGQYEGQAHKATCLRCLRVRRDKALRIAEREAAVARETADAYDKLAGHKRRMRALRGK